MISWAAFSAVVIRWSREATRVVWADAGKAPQTRSTPTADRRIGGAMDLML